MQKMNLENIENRLLELEEETRGVAPSFGKLSVEKAQLEKKRQFILDERNSGWKPKILWNIIIPIIVSLITSFLITKFYLK